VKNDHGREGAVARWNAENRWDSTWNICAWIERLSDGRELNGRRCLRDGKQWDEERKSECQSDGDSMSSVHGILLRQTFPEV
jgi:hypothetical protein